MRFLIKASWAVEAGNELAKNGVLGSTVQSILEELQPEAAYFLAEHGKRTAFLFLDMQDASQIPAVAEPWFLACNASIDIQPVMTAEDLQKAGPAIEQAAKKYG
jgi:hypothetical protein